MLAFFSAIMLKIGRFGLFDVIAHKEMKSKRL